MPRKGESLNRRTESLIRAVSHVDGNLLERLALISEDESLPLKMRLDALRYLSGALHGRVRLSAAAKSRLKAEMKGQAV